MTGETKVNLAKEWQVELERGETPGELFSRLLEEDESNLSELISLYISTAFPGAYEPTLSTLRLTFYSYWTVAITNWRDAHSKEELPELFGYLMESARLDIFANKHLYPRLRYGWRFWRKPKRPVDCWEKLQKLTELLVAHYEPQEKTHEEPPWLKFEMSYLGLQNKDDALKMTVTEAGLDARTIESYLRLSGSPLVERADFLWNASQFSLKIGRELAYAREKSRWHKRTSLDSLLLTFNEDFYTAEEVKSRFHTIADPESSEWILPEFTGLPEAETKFCALVVEVFDEIWEESDGR